MSRLKLCKNLLMKSNMENTERTLHLHLMAPWYDMIASGQKKEEYREIKDHWTKRLLTTANYPESPVAYNTVLFYRGYTSYTIKFEIKSITVGYGKPEWGAKPNKMYYVISLGKQIN